MNILTTAFRLILAFILGSVIGYERERKKRRAGLRTHILVCVGSALIMLVSLYVYHLYGESVAIDPTRIAAGVVTGIGFLGAGTIIRSSEGVKGLTTAASIWLASAIGLAVGCGFISAALIATFLVYLILSFLKRIEKEKIKK
ncbi:MAG: MgtC/SapB family protein [Candidatus Omnitrophica bacterium]|nr:MgtC/SapB family protein [Candidatus Omnitrophota bacterium]MCF7894003.1 MgtC/SapB family protein [Candidatus Omnitrophota bacterium]